MRRAAFALLFAGCAIGARPYRFASPMLGMADVPPAWSGAAHASDRRAPVDPYAEPPRNRRDPMPEEVRSSHAVTVRVASAAAADAIPHDGIVWSRLPAPHRLAKTTTAESTATAREPADLRAFVGRRTADDPLQTVLAWSRRFAAELDLASIVTGDDLVVRASEHGRLAGPTADIGPGDLLVFDRTDSDVPSDLVAVAIGRDARGVIEMIYVAGGVVRRGFVDPHHPSQHRDATGAVLNTFMRAGKRWPPKGTHYLAGELLGHVIRVLR